MLALNPDTGELKWYYQEIPHDVWDWDSAYECVLIDAVIQGSLRKLIIHPNKGGYVWVLDRTNGQFVTAWPFVENLNWITGIDAKGNLLGRKKSIPGESELICPSVSVRSKLEPWSLQPADRLFLYRGHGMVPDHYAQKGRRPHRGALFRRRIFVQTAAQRSGRWTSGCL